jgi:hypothetical protein
MPHGVSTSAFLSRIVREIQLASLHAERIELTKSKRRMAR